MTDHNHSLAKNFAALAHATQAYNEDVPYTVHLDNVVAELCHYGYTSSYWMCCGYLHDIIEDTTRSYGDIAKRFGHDVAETVFAVTNELGRNRKERNAKTYPKVAANPDAIILKLADRIANVRYGLESGGGKTDMYAAEFADFCAALYPHSPPGAKSMWVTLARLLDESKTLEQVGRDTSNESQL